MTVWIFAVAEIEQRDEILRKQDDVIHQQRDYIKELEQKYEESLDNQIDFIGQLLSRHEHMQTHNQCFRCGGEVGNYGGIHICKDCGANQSEMEGG